MLKLFGEKTQRMEFGTRKSNQIDKCPQDSGAGHGSKKTYVKVSDSMAFAAD